LWEAYRDFFPLIFLSLYVFLRFLRKMETPRLAQRMGAVLEDEACHEDISIGIGEGMY
jgi:hypothetical protein